MSLVISPLSKRLDLEPLLWEDELMTAWPEFMLNDPVANLYFGKVRFERYYAYMLVAFNTEKPDKLLARAFSVPFCFGEAFDRPILPDGGWDTIVRWADQDYAVQRQPNAVSALEITVSVEARGRGLSIQMLKAMADNAKRLGFSSLYAPVRPSHKHLEPAISIKDYAQRQREDGLPYDPWLRVHMRAGGRIIKIAPYSMVIAGSLESWREWTDLPFDQSGNYFVPHALVPVYVSLEQNHAVYVEPNVWVHHRLNHEP